MVEPVIGLELSMLAETDAVSGHRTSLEERVILNFSSGDVLLRQMLSPNLAQNYTMLYSEPSSLSRSTITRPDNLYLIDLLHVDSDGYGILLEKIKQIRAINPESKVVLLVTERQQNDPDFNAFKNADEYRLLGVLTRPDQSQLPETEYMNALLGMADTLPGFLNQYQKTNGRFENVEVVKIGGSIFDLYSDDPAALPGLLAAIVEIHKTQDLILTVGGGPLMEVPAGFRTSYNISDKRFQESSRAQITQQALNVVDLLSQIKPGIVAYIPPEFVIPALRDGWITREFLNDKIPVFSYLPEDSIDIGLRIPPYNASDAHTVLFADRLGSRKIIFAKNTDGIYTRDPNLPRTLLGHLREQFRGRPQFLDFVYAQHIEEQIERIGLNQRRQPTPEHLIETAAIPLFLQSGLYTIQVVNGTKPNTLVDAMNGIRAGSYILK